MIINYTISGSTPSGFGMAVQTAVQFFETALTNNVTVNLAFNWAPLASSVVAETATHNDAHAVSYTSWAAALLANARGVGGTADNLIAADALPATSPFSGANGNIEIPYPLAQAIGLAITRRQRRSGRGGRNDYAQFHSILHLRSQ